MRVISLRTRCSCPPWTRSRRQVRTSTSWASCPTAASTAGSTISMRSSTWPRRRVSKIVYFHAFLDGRDTPPSSAIEYITALENYFSKTGLGRIASVSGRYYAMDRDKRWERVQKAYEALVLGEGLQKIQRCRGGTSRATNMDGRTSSCCRP